MATSCNISGETGSVKVKRAEDKREVAPSAPPNKKLPKKNLKGFFFES